MVPLGMRNVHANMFILDEHTPVSRSTVDCAYTVMAKSNFTPGCGCMVERERVCVCVCVRNNVQQMFCKPVPFK